VANDMFLIKIQRLAVILMLITFVSQAVAFDFYLPQAPLSKPMHSSMQSSMHHSMDTAAHQSSSSMSMDCCQNGDNCSMSTCHAFMATPHFRLPLAERIAEQIQSNHNFYSSYNAPSLYRPPITA
jgi:hypothetical protein